MSINEKELKKIDGKKFVVSNLTHCFIANSKKEEPVKVLSDISLSVEKNEFIAIVGPSGCGKSTLLNLMSGLLTPQQGEIVLDGQPLRGINSNIGYIAQNDTLLPWRNAIANVELGLEIRKYPSRVRKEKALALMKQAELNGFEKSYPYQLSGGMRKRIDIIKVLALDPEIIFMDEPFASLDVFTREMLQNYILDVWQREKRTIIFITHDLTEAIMLADRVVVLTNRPATVKAEYIINLPRPRSLEVLRFDDKFIKLHKKIWDKLKDEVQAEEKLC